jgi:hypothetical protein
MATPDKTAVARWASALTLGLPTPVADTFDATKYFAKAPLRIHYAAVFNGATATQIHMVSPFNWICCVQPEDLASITTGAALVALVEMHLTDQLKAAAQPAAAVPVTMSAAMPGDEAFPEEEETLPLADGGAE